MTERTDIIINGNSTLCKELGVVMGDDFLTTLGEPLTPKEYAQTESRREHGKRILIDVKNGLKFASREITLSFVLVAKDAVTLLKNQRAFLSHMYKGAITLQVPEFSDEVFRLVYTGNGSSFTLNAQRTLVRMMLKFEEINPMNRGELTAEDLGYLAKLKSPTN